MEQIKNILILSTPNPYKTAGVVAYDLFKGFRTNNYSVKLVVENYDKYEDGIVSVQNKHGLFYKKVKNKLRKVFFNFKEEHDTLVDYHFDNARLRKQNYSTKLILNKAGFKPDIIVVVFSQYFISYKNLKEMQELTNAPIIWQFADMFPFTGGCHYAWDCNGYKRLCESCPAMLSSQNNDRPNKALLKNIEYIKDLNITAVIGSNWLINRAKKSTIFKKVPIKKIYLSLDTDLFRPYDDVTKRKIRDNYDIDINEMVILIMANNLTHKRKGINLVLDAFSRIDEEYIKRNRCHLVIVGKEFESIKERIPSYLPFSHIESLERKKLPDIYNLSDLFVSASLQDVGPYTITEALLCSIPVVSLNHGYANEFVVDYETGILIEDDLPESIADGIIRLSSIETNELDKIKDNCRKRTESIVSKDQQIQEYIKLINSFDYEIR